MPGRTPIPARQSRVRSTPLFQDRLNQRIFPPAHSFVPMVLLQLHGIPEWSIPCSGAPQQRLINPNSSECPDLKVQYREEQRVEQEMSSRRPVYTAEDALNEPSVNEAIKRGIIEVKGNRITYNLGVKKSYDWSDHEEWVRARTVAFLIIERGLPCEPDENRGPGSTSHTE